MEYNNKEITTNIDNLTVTNAFFSLSLLQRCFIFQNKQNCATITKNRLEKEVNDIL